MKLTLDRAALLKALAHVQSVVERRNTIPILSNIKMEAGDDSLRLTATDMDLDVAEATAAEVARAGATTVPAHTIYDIVRKLPDGAQVEIEATDGGQRVVLRCGRSRFTLACLPIEDFPLMAAEDLPFRFTLAAKDLRGLIDRTRFAISTEETRYYLNGIYLHALTHGAAEVLRAVATDGHRLASVEVALPEGAAGMPGVIIPRKTVVELRKLIDGTFPDYERVIPANNDKTLDVECKLFAAAVDRVSAISSDRSRAVKLAMANGTLVLSANSPDSGSATEELEVSYQGEALEIGFNSRYLLDITQQIEGEQAQFSIADAASPTILRELGDSRAIYVLMPMRV